MKKSFAEQIIDSMVDENGHCGERGLSPKQFKILVEHLDEGETHNVGGAYNRTFTSTDFTGTIGRYNVKLNEYYHFNPRYTVVEIDAEPESYGVYLNKNATELRDDINVVLQSLIDNGVIQYLLLKHSGAIISK